MSAFLGPVHHWMYGKIQLQEALTARLITLSGDPAFAGLMEEIYGAVDSLPLEEIIDQSNIHGWLNQRVRGAEARYAAVVQSLLEHNGGDLLPLVNAARAFGGEHAVPNGVGVSEAYQAIDGVLLDGMPCDGGRQVVSEQEDELVFEYEAGLHDLALQGEVGASAFAALRGALLDGMLAGSGIKAETLGQSIYRLTKEG
jgi:hypothetical protein